MLRKALLVQAVLVLAWPMVAHAHGWMVSASTPLTPPITLLFVPMLFVVAMVWWDRRVLGAGVGVGQLLWREVTLLGVVYLTIFFLGFVDPNGPASPHKPFYGLAWTPWILWFLFWNAVLYSYLAVLKYGFFRTLRLPPGVMRRLRKGTLTVYAISLVPFLAASSTLHGWCGVYAGYDCNARRFVIGEGLLRYAEANGQRLPMAENIEEVVTAIRPFLEQADFRRASSMKTSALAVCPIEAARRIHPRKYEWNQSFSGVSLDDAFSRDPTEAIFSCPLHEFVHRSPALTVEHFQMLKERRDNPDAQAPG